MKSSEKTSKTRFAVLIDAPKLDTSYNSMGSIWELEIVRIDPGKEEPRNCARRSEGRLSEEEARLMTHVSRWGSDGYPIKRCGRGWSWGTDDVKGPPEIFKTKRAAAESFERWEGIMRDKLAGRI